MTFLAYVHARPETVNQHGIFYVGKGMGKRHLNLTARNAHHANIIAKYGAKNILIGKLECSSEQIAFDLEIGLIKCLHRNGVRLANMTNGGEGSAGRETLQSTRDKLSIVSKGAVRSPEYRSKISKTLTGRKLSTERIEKGRQSQLGKKHSVEWRAAISKGLVGRKLSEAHSKLISVTKAGKIAITNGTADKMVASDMVEKMLNTGEWQRGFAQSTCPHCKKTGARGLMVRWHNDNCKENK
jgi:hypothetical protein